MVPLDNRSEGFQIRFLELRGNGFGDFLWGVGKCVINAFLQRIGKFLHYVGVFFQVT